MAFPDRLIDHSTQAAQLVDAGLTARHIVDHALAALGTNSAPGLVAIPAQ
jgi:1-deoxy-D-xylulose-5-phosphate synthase